MNRLCVKVTLGIVVGLCLALLNGCGNQLGGRSGPPESREELLSYLHDGFDGEYPRLFFGRREDEPYPRIALILEYIGHRWERLGPLRAAPDGNTIVIEDRSYYVEAARTLGSGQFIEKTRLLIISERTGIGVVEVPIASSWTDTGEVISLTGAKVGPRNAVPDNAGVYLAASDGSDASVQGDDVHTTLQIYSVGDINTPLATSEMAVAEALYTTDSYVYLIGGNSEGRPAPSVVEIYARDGTKLVLKNRIRIRCPRFWGFATHMFPIAFDGVNRQIVFRIMHDAMFVRDPYYIYSIDTGKLGKIGTSPAIFVNPLLFDNVLPMERERCTGLRVGGC